MSTGQVDRGPVAVQFTDAALAHLERIVVDGLRHGFFDCGITCEIGVGRKRHLVIRAGKSEKFIISEDELPR